MSQHQLSAAVTPQTEAPAAAPAWPVFDHAIAREEAHEMIVRHKRAHPGERHATAFTRVALDRILAQDGCAGIRAYYALNPDGTRTLVLVGVSADGRDLDTGALAERGYPCPPFCDIGGLLDV